MSNIEDYLVIKIESTNYDAGEGEGEGVVVSSAQGGSGSGWASPGLEGWSMTDLGPRHYPHHLQLQCYIL